MYVEPGRARKFFDHGTDVLGGPVRASRADVAGGCHDQVDGLPVGAQAEVLQSGGAVGVEHIGDVVLVGHQSRYQVAVVVGVCGVEDPVAGHHDAADGGGVGDVEVPRHLPQGFGGRTLRGERRGVLGHRAFELRDGQVEDAGQSQPCTQDPPCVLRTRAGEFAEERQIVHFGIVDQSVYMCSTSMDRTVYQLVEEVAAVAGPRERLIQGAIELMREYGVHATGLSDLLERSNTARGSIYQHFPAGKTELMEQATLAAGRVITARIRELTAAMPAEDVIRAFVEGWKQDLIASEFSAGCPIMAAAQAGPDALAVREASAKVFADWAETIADSIESKGGDATTANSLGNFIVSSLEGAIIQCRSARSLQPLDDACAGLVLLLSRIF